MCKLTSKIFSFECCKVIHGDSPNPMYYYLGFERDK